MTQHPTSEEKMNRLKIQAQLPIRAVGIETQRERKNYSDLPPQNYIHVWWARRPTPATRLGILSSVLPAEVDNDSLLKWMGMNPSNLTPGSSIEEHVRNKNKTVDSRDGFVYEHYGYRKAYKNLPSEEEFKELHNTIKSAWGGELPTVLDATAGGGSIPFESVRYELPTIANELNPVASVILKAVLQHPRAGKDLSGDIEKWGNYINDQAREALSEYFPSSTGSEKPLEYIWAHTITCPDCGLTVPLSPNWWLHKESGSSGIAAHPQIDEESDRVEFSVVNLPRDIEKSEFNPTDGTVSYGKATCPRCQVTIETDEVKEQANSGDMGTQLYAVHIEKKTSGEERIFRAPREVDREANESAKESVEGDPELATLLTTEIPDGKETKRLKPFGIENWRDLYSSRQLLVHYTYWQAFEKAKEEIRSEYTQKEAEAILTYLAIAADKAVDYNCRLSLWDNSVPKIAHVFSRHDFAFAWSFAESNLTVEGLGYDWVLESTVEVYEELRELSGHSNAPTQVYQGDAADLQLDDESVEAVVLDPPYYDNVMYAELSDFFYVWLDQYLGDIYPDFFTGQLTEKDDEAVANPSKFSGITGESQSKDDLAKDDYENKMSDIFADINRVLTNDGIFTLMFTHKKTEAWDTLTTALIESGFVVTATHPISTENPNSLHQAGKNAAESTILLASEKRDSETEDYTLWSDIQRETQKVARDKARDLDESEVDFAKVDVILASFGPTLEVFTKNYPVVDDEGEEVTPQTALDQARIAVRDYFIDKYLNEGVREVDPKTEWYILSWLVFEAQRFPYDEARRLAIGIGEDLDSLKKPHRMWRKRSGDVLLRPHEDRVQDVNKDSDNRSGRKPVNPDSLSFATSLDKVHAAMHILDAKGSTEAWNWLNDRNCGSDPSFKATLEALLRVLPHDYDDWKLARDLAAGETGELLDLELDADIFRDEEDEDGYQGDLDDF
ncbi:DUF1156 domain-containing protein [Halobellus ordinarius]|uniref:DUF1156 domain-containing protein n=1 Tax=Halobellus ordinarius TaxID=3075120 RepID=UPI002880540F|nr:DUF1156 domain-containing protein [Halobellus sp. ZY16]